MAKTAKLMISHKSVTEIFETANIVEVMEEFETLKKSGSNYACLSPFTEEKTPSCMVSPSKNIFKDFSSGTGGGPIKYLQETQNWSFVECLEYLAKKYNITLEYEESTKTKEDLDFEKRLELCLKAANRFFRKNYRALRPDGADEMFCLTGKHSDVVIELEGKRCFSQETIEDWELGFAPDDWRTLTPLIVEAGYYNEAQELGLVKSKNGRNFDVLRNRITFPIRNHLGQLIGFGGRHLYGEKPKYLNSPEHPLYKKNHVLYGLHLAAEAIRKEGFAYLTEGYTDVISMHQIGLKNTVATCGTSLTVGHARLLKRYTQHIVLLRDGDKAGTNASAKDMEQLIKFGFKVEMCELDPSLDPDDVCRQHLYIV